ncbi:olfactory receptor 5AR1-like [Mantella aurantiaca]
MKNQTLLNELYLSGLSDLPALQLPLFLFFLLIYLLTLIWNLLIIILIVTDSHLHTPMYFFLGNLAGMDLGCSSVTVPRMLYDLYTQRRKITTMACMTQIFFFMFFDASDVLLLSVMSYDRYTAICKPLHYMQIMSCKVRLQLMLLVFCLSVVNSLVHTFFAFRLTFCESHIIESFFCDLPQLLKISCSDIYINILLVFLFGCFLGGGSLLLTFLPYVSIFQAVLKIKANSSRSKVFSTCTPHLTVVFIFYFSVVFNYFRPSVNHHFAGDKAVSAFYSVILPLLNPVIYSLRNQDFIKAFKDILRKIVSKSIQN